jgi:glutamyl-Q tRNA(Asp) synthetase
LVSGQAKSAMQPVFRFAPSPTGALHLGHALSAFIDFDLCQRAGGRFLLRIEDIDRTRCRPEYEAAIHDDLRWLGIAWEEPVRRQSEHMAAYQAALDRLTAMGLLYPALMTRVQIEAATAGRNWPHDPDGTPLYPGADRDLDPDTARARMASGAPFSQRLRTDLAVTKAGPLSWSEQGSGPDGETGTVAAMPTAWGDVVLARKEMPTSYHLSVVVDDALQGVTTVVRGRDLFHATSIHVLLQKLLGLPSPTYHHHRLLLDADGRKLSKSERSPALAALRAAGATASDVRRLVGL